jgi:hypothetical protein
MGEHGQALRFYEEALIPAAGDGDEDTISEELEEHNWVCKSGYAIFSINLKNLTLFNCFIWPFWSNFLIAKKSA